MADSNMPHSGAVPLTETASVMDPDFANFMDSVKSAGPEPPQATSEPVEGTNNKRKRDEDKKAAQPKKEKKPKAPRENTSVYVTGIPLDATFDEIHELFKSRGGLIMKNVDDEKPRIKMYADEEGNFKGEALITFFKANSIEMSLLLLDKTDFRKGGTGSMRVQEADMSYKKQKGDEKEVSEEKGGFKKARSGKDVEKIKRMTKEMNDKLADWSDEDPQTMPDTTTKPASKWDKCVIVKRLFTLDEVKDDPKVPMEIEEELREQAKDEAWGEITKVVVYDLEAEGVVMLRFSDVDGAETAVRKMDGRFFDGRQLQAEVPSSRPRYKRSANLDDDTEAARLEAYGKDLEAE